MLTIRMQRTGRKGHAMFRVVVQESRLTPTSGKVVAQLGHYDPHAKTIILDKEKAAFYLGNGAQPSDRAARLLQGEGVQLPKWVKLAADKSSKTRNPDKLRKNNPQTSQEATQPEKLADSESPATTDEAEAATTETEPEA
jgi:small subunit ribosomal protein S16